MLTEVDAQLASACHKPITTAIASVGVGSWAQAVAAHYGPATGSSHPHVQIVTVEPEHAACLQESLRQDAMTTVETQATIMNGMNCGTVSSIAWPVLRERVDVAIAVGEWEAHECVREFEGRGLDVGPCGAATLAAARRLLEAGLLGTGEDEVVVLFSTEGRRGHPVPSPP